jgi:hypothetical protein
LQNIGEVSDLFRKAEDDMSFGQPVCEIDAIRILQFSLPPPAGEFDAEMLSPRGVTKEKFARFDEPLNRKRWWVEKTKSRPAAVCQGAFRSGRWGWSDFLGQIVRRDRKFDQGEEFVDAMITRLGRTNPLSGQ